MEESNDKTFLKKMRKTKGYELLSTFIKSAAVGLLFAVICFVYDVYHDSEQDKQLEQSIEKLVSIEQSLSTRYLGIFPEYISEIDDLFENLVPSDTIVIFEDVLYYGIKSRPREFFNLNKKLFEHVMNGGNITVAYYDFKKKSGRPAWYDIFHKMIVGSRINPKYHPIMNETREKEIEKMRQTRQLVGNGAVISRMDSTLCETYFAATRDDNREKFKKDVDAYLSPDLITNIESSPTPAELVAHWMCLEIDSVKQLCLGNGKSIDDILYYDYETMYRQMSEVIVKFYSRYGFDLLPLNEYLTMSCWMVHKGNRKGVRTVLAFPSKYSTDEIGFYSQDEAFLRYISTMLEGVKQNRRISQRSDL